MTAPSARFSIGSAVYQRHQLGLEVARGFGKTERGAQGSPNLGFAFNQQAGSTAEPSLQLPSTFHLPAHTFAS